MQRRILISVVLSLSFISLGQLLDACTYEEKQAEEMTPCNSTNVTFLNTVKPILDDNCVVCHSSADPADGLNFESYQGVMEVAMNGRLIGSIKHLSGYAPMPEFAPKLPDCDIMKIEMWITDGAPNN